MKAVTLKSLLIAALSALALPAAAEPFRLIITDMEAPLVPNSIVDIALSEGYFTRAGVEVELIRVQQTPMALAALQSGQGEMANVATEGLVQLAARGNDRLRAVMSPNKALPYLIAGRAGMTLEGLAGQAFGIGRVGSLDQLLSLKVLEGKGVAPDSLRLVALGQPDVRARALAAGQIAATTLSVGTWAALPDHEALPVLVAVDAYYQAAPVVSKVNAVTTETLTARRAEVEAVITALTLAARDMAADPEAWPRAMAKLRPDVAPEVLAELALAFQTSWAVNGGLQGPELRQTADWLFATEEFAGLTRPDPAAWAEFGPLDAVLQNIGIVGGGDGYAR
ncbi:ABC transporter substrate-binding protein [Falsigemmobacter faecalis]|uniref:ABC transporter substrate-binding protein n=1 Tax=Falsigemmobacter faecalis TaxID=2488730 RepID=A0A3P3D7E7_9RHOB|nr:ABC transporter substrate-binding protein [Falsigemmobacter faecalis]RRH70300.1 ABC transporter substrate-binding protein [Falsigemmobacter faecalis]